MMSLRMTRYDPDLLLHTVCWRLRLVQPGMMRPSQNDPRCSALQAGRTVMLVNCGACEDIREYLQLSPQARLIVVDSHRPIHARCSRGPPAGADPAHPLVCGQRCSRKGCIRGCTPSQLASLDDFHVIGSRSLDAHNPWQLCVQMLLCTGF